MRLLTLYRFVLSYIAHLLFSPEEKSKQKSPFRGCAPKDPNGGRRWIWMTTRDTSRRRYRCSDSRQPCSTFERFDSCMRLRRYASAWRGYRRALGPVVGLTWCDWRSHVGIGDTGDLAENAFCGGSFFASHTFFAGSG